VQHYDFEYIKTIKMNETNDIFEYSIDVQPLNETAFKVNGESELKVELDDSWTVRFFFLRIVYEMVIKLILPPRWISLSITM
jgi:hypothetical protein